MLEYYSSILRCVKKNVCKYYKPAQGYYLADYLVIGYNHYLEFLLVARQLESDGQDVACFVQLGACPPCWFQENNIILTIIYKYQC